MRQEVVPDEEAEENEIIDQALHLELERELQLFELEVEVLPEHRNLHILEFSDTLQLGRILSEPCAALGMDVTSLTVLR